MTVEIKTLSLAARKTFAKHAVLHVLYYNYPNPYFKTLAKTNKPNLQKFSVDNFKNCS